MIFSLNIWFPYLFLSYQRFKRWSKPATLSLICGVGSDLVRSRSDLVIENAILRQQLIILNRQVRRPHLTIHDRIRLVFLSRFTRF